MPSLYDLPDMGVDYGQLSRLSAPVMMPNAPIGAGGMAGQMYYQDKARHDDALNQAGKLAQIQAQLKEQAASEYQQGGSGRQAEIQYGNEMSQGKLGSLQTDLSTQRDTSEAKSVTANTAKKAAILNSLNDYANDWVNGKTPEAKALVKDRMDRDGVMLGSRKASELSDEQMDALMQMRRNSQVNTPPHEQAMDIEEQRGANWNNRENIRGQYRLASKAMDMEIKKLALEYKATADSKKGETLSQWEASQWKDMGEGKMDEAHKAAFIKYQMDKNANYTAMNANKSPTMNPDALNTPGQTPIVNAPKTPAVAPIPPQPNAAKKTKDGYLIKGTRATNAEGKEFRVIGEDGNGKYVIDDGKNTVIGP